MLKLLISCWYDGVVVACRYMFAMGSDVVLVLLLLYCEYTLRHSKAGGGLTQHLNPSQTCNGKGSNRTIQYTNYLILHQ